MSRRTLLLIIALGGLIAAIAIAGRNRSVAIRGLSWKNDGKEVSFDFILSNLTSEREEIEMTLIAYNIGSMGMTGLGSSNLGAKRLSFGLLPREERTVTGEYDLNSPPRG